MNDACVLKYTRATLVKITFQFRKVSLSEFFVLGKTLIVIPLE